MLENTTVLLKIFNVWTLCIFIHTSFVIDTSSTLSENQHVSLEKLLKEATDASQAFSSQHKDSHGAISRMGKAIDRVSLTVCQC